MGLPTVQQTPWSSNSNSAVSTQTATAGSASLAGDTIIFVVEWGATNQTITVADNANGGSNIYNLVQNGQSSSGNNAAVYIATNIVLPASGNLAITVTFGGGTSSKNLLTAIELTGVSSYNAVDLLGNISVLTSPASTTFPNNLNLLSNLEFLVAVLHSDASGGTLTANSGWTLASSNTSNTKGVAYSTNNGTAPVSITANPFTSSVSVTTLLIIVGFAFSPTVSATPPPTNLVQKNGHYLPQGLISLQNFKGTQYSDLAWIGQTAADPGWLSPGVTGFKTRVHWNDIQPTSSTAYDWSYLDAVFAMAAQTGKIIGINLVMGTSSPSWVFTAGSSQFTFQGFTNPSPPPWDTIFQGILQTFFQALSTRYGSNQLLSYIELTGMGRGNQAGDWCQATADNTELLNVATANGYSSADSGVAIWVSGSNKIADIFASVFPTLPIIFTKGGPVYNRDSSGYFTALGYALTRSNFGLKDNALNSTYNSSGLQQMAYALTQYSASHPAGMQRNQPATLSSEWLTSMQVAQGFGTWFIEIYPSEEPLIGSSQLAITNQQFVQLANLANMPSNLYQGYKSVKHQDVLYSVTRRMGIDPKVTLTTPVAEAYLTYINERCREAWEKFDWTDLVIYEQRAFEDPWQSTITYSTGQTIFDWSSMLYWTSLVNANFNNPPATSPTFWGPATMFAPFIIPTNQVTYDEIGTLYDVLAVDPRSYTNPNRVGWERIQSGVVLYPDRVYSDSTPYGPLLVQGSPIPGQIVGYNGQFPTTVWLVYRLPYPGFATSYYSDSNTYNIGDLAFFGTDTYKSLSVQTAQSPTVSPSTWQIIGFPYVLSEFVKKAAFVDALIDDGQHEKGGLEEPRAYVCLDREYDKQILQQGQQSFYTVSGA